MSEFVFVDLSGISYEEAERSFHSYQRGAKQPYSIAVKAKNSFDYDETPIDCRLTVTRLSKKQYGSDNLTVIDGDLRLPNDEVISLEGTFRRETGKGRFVFHKKVASSTLSNPEGTLAARRPEK